MLLRIPFHTKVIFGVEFIEPAPVNRSQSQFSEDVKLAAEFNVTYTDCFKTAESLFAGCPVLDGERPLLNARKIVHSSNCFIHNS